MNLWYYKRFVNGYNFYGGTYSNKKNDYNYTIKPPNYFSFQGNFALSNRTDTLSLIIWPGLFFKEEYKYEIIEIMCLAKKEWPN
jgi:hypothetical protein